MTPIRLNSLFSFKRLLSSSSSASSTENLVKFGEYLSGCLPKFIEKVTVSPRGGELNVYVPASGLLPCLQFLRDHSACQYAQLMDLTAVDWPADATTKGRFELIYCLLSLKHNSRLVVHCRAPSSTHPSVPSVTSLYSSANWAERETYDMFGIMFEGHPDLRRILTDYGFEGHPLRKDFPLTGFVEVRYDEEKKRVIEEPVELTQEFRKFEYSSPWEQVPKKQEIEHSEKPKEIKDFAFTYLTLAFPMEEGFDAPIEHFQFRQMPAEFKLKSCPESIEKPTWADSWPPRASLLQISHQKGLLFYPHYERGALAFVPVANLAEKDYLPADAIGFPGDESTITVIYCTSSFVLIGKESKKLYAVDLALDNPVKKPFVAKIAELDSKAIQIAFWNDAVVAVLDDGRVKSFSLPELQARDELLPELKSKKVSCVSAFEERIAFGCADANEIVLLHESKASTLQVPSEDIEGTGISSLFFASSSTLLCSIKAKDENDYVDLIVIDNPFDDSPRFTKFLDPCTSRPPAPNQFYFCGLNDWSLKDLKELVLIGNFASPDIGLAARLSADEPFGTFFIDFDQGLAQLPLLKNGDLTYPVGLALDFTSTMTHKNRQDPDAGPFCAAPVLWILTSAGQLCPFALLKTNEAGPWPFMKEAPQLQLSPPRPLEAAISDADDSPPTSPAFFKSTVAPSDLSAPRLSSEEEDECSDEQVPVTPSKMSLSAITSLQKSAEKLSDAEGSSPSASPAPKIVFNLPPKKEIESPKPFIAPVKPTFEPFKPSLVPQSSPALSSASSMAAPSPMSTVSQEPTIPAPIKKEEVMESITCSPYQGILLNEVAEAHEAMQNDLHSLRQLVYKNSILLRQNTVKYFSTLEALGVYAGKVESLLGSGERVFSSLKEKSAALKASFDSVFGEAKRLQGFCDGVKNDSKIDWQRKAAQLEQLSEEVAEKISQLQELLAQPAAKRASLATITCLHQSIQERLQVLMIYLSTLFVSSVEKEDPTRGTLDRMRSLCLSSESLVDEMSALFIASAQETSKKKRHERLLELAKSRGARLLIPSEVKKSSEQMKPMIPMAKDSVDDKLIEEFISAVKLNDSVPEFRETASIAQMSFATSAPLTTSSSTPSKTEAKSTLKPVEKAKSFLKTTSPFKPQEQSKPFTFAKPAELPKPKEESKPVEPLKPVEALKPTFSFAKPVESTEQSKPTFSFTKPAESTEQSKPTFSFAKPAVEEKPGATVAASNPFSFTNASSGSESSTSVNTTATSAFSFSFPKPTAKAEVKDTKESKEEVKPFAFSFSDSSKSETKVESSSPASDSSFLSIPSKPAEKDAFSFKFDFTSSAPASTANTETQSAPSNATVPEAAKKPIPGILSVSPAEPEKAPIPALLTAQNAFAPPSLTSPEKPSFSLTSTPTFGASPQPAFGQTSFGFNAPAQPVQSAQPSFGQTSMPSASFLPAVNAAAPKPGAFAAFAQSGAQSLGFSSFTAPAGAQASNGLSFASFANPNANASANANTNSSAEQEKDKPKPSFSFSGFRG